MKTLDEAIAIVARRIKQNECSFDMRDVGRFLEYVPSARMKEVDERLNPDGYDPEQYKPWVGEVVWKEVLEDARFGQEKQDNQRGLSTAAMRSVMEMWAELVLDAGDLVPCGFQEWIAEAEKRLAVIEEKAKRDQAELAMDDATPEDHDDAVRAVENIAKAMAALSVAIVGITDSLAYTSGAFDVSGLRSAETLMSEALANMATVAGRYEKATA